MPVQAPRSANSHTMLVQRLGFRQGITDDRSLLSASFASNGFMVQYHAECAVWTGG